MKWIDVKERLPEKEGKYLVYGEYISENGTEKDFDFADYEKTWVDLISIENDNEVHKKRTGPCRFICYMEVTHWSHLPDHP